jgi:hypothetical protein
MAAEALDAGATHVAYVCFVGGPAALVW